MKRKYILGGMARFCIFYYLISFKITWKIFSFFFEKLRNRFHKCLNMTNYFFLFKCSNLLMLIFEICNVKFRIRSTIILTSSTINRFSWRNFQYNVLNLFHYFFWLKCFYYIQIFLRKS